MLISILLLMRQVTVLKNFNKQLSFDHEPELFFEECQCVMSFGIKDTHTV